MGRIAFINFRYRTNAILHHGLFEAVIKTPDFSHTLCSVEPEESLSVMAQQPWPRGSLVESLVALLLIPAVTALVLRILGRKAPQAPWRQQFFSYRVYHFVSEIGLKGAVSQGCCNDLIRPDLIV